MTPLEIARECLSKFDGCLVCTPAHEAEDAIVAAIEKGAASAYRDATERAAKIAESHYIPGHSVAGPHFAAQLAARIRNQGKERGA